MVDLSLPLPEIPLVSISGAFPIDFKFNLLERPSEWLPTKMS